MADKVTRTRIETLIPDDRNFNKGTEYGDHLMTESLQKFGLGRSILIDKNNRIIAGNKTHAKAGELGFDNVIVVETDGKSLVAVKRTDIDIDSTDGRELALADNATAKANLEFDKELIKEASEKFDFDPEDWGVSVQMPNDEEMDDEKGNGAALPKLIIECGDHVRLSLLYNELEERGFSCELRD